MNAAGCSWNHYLRVVESATTHTWQQWPRRSWTDGVLKLRHPGLKTIAALVAVAAPAVSIISTNAGLGVFIK